MSGFGRAVSRILSSPRNSRERIICLSGRYPKPVPPKRNTERAAPRLPIWPCTRWGFPCLASCLASGELLPHLFTLARPLRARRSNFLWHFPSKCFETFCPRVSLSRPMAGAGLRGIAPSGVRTFLPALSKFSFANGCASPLWQAAALNPQVSCSENAERARRFSALPKPGQSMAFFARVLKLNLVFEFWAALALLCKLC